MSEESQFYAEDLVRFGSADAQMLRVDLYQLAERILQTASNRDRSSHRRVEVGELFTTNVTGRVNARAGLVDNQVPNVGTVFRDDFADQFLGLAARCSIANCDQVASGVRFHRLPGDEEICEGRQR